MEDKSELIPAEAAERSGYSPGHIRWLARTGKVASRRIGERVLLIDAASLDAYVFRMRRLGNRKHAPKSDSPPPLLIGMPET